MRIRWILAALLASAAPAAARADVVIDFEDLTLAPDSFRNGMPPSPVAGQTYDGTFTSGGATFNNTWTRLQFGPDLYELWDGWSYSNLGTTQTDPGGLTEYSSFQYHSAAGGGFGGSGNFGVAFVGSATIDLPTSLPFQPATMTARITNTAYTALSVLNGDQFAKKFGGVSGDDPDVLELTIIGYSGPGQTGTVVGEVPFRLADYSFADNSLDYVVRDWRLVDLSDLIGAGSLGFRMTSTDIDPVFGGYLTPSYFALDDLTIAPAAVPEPSTLALFVAGLLGTSALLARRRARRPAS